MHRADSHVLKCCTNGKAPACMCMTGASLGRSPEYHDEQCADNDESDRPFCSNVHRIRVETIDDESRFICIIVFVKIVGACFIFHCEGL